MAEEQNKKEQPAQEGEVVRIPFAEFLESYPLGSLQHVSNYYAEKKGSNEYNPYARLAPVLRLYCPKCEGVRNFAGHWTHERDFRESKVVKDFLNYTCKDCGNGEKIFCVVSQATDNDGNGCAVKVGEIPELHLELPRSLKALLGDDYELFTKGLTSEKRGLGIGAFTYYRRVVEAQKSHLIAKILLVAEKLGASDAIIGALKQAATEKQFSRAVNLIKDAIPESLLVDTHNPLKLLHDALSIGVHAETDENCLRVAHNIRLVLADLAERIKLALQDQKQLRSAVAGLLKFNADAKKAAKADSQNAASATT
jgi:hypothetical protein